MMVKSVGKLFQSSEEAHRKCQSTGEAPVNGYSIMILIIGLLVGFIAGYVLSTSIISNKIEKDLMYRQFIGFVTLEDEGEGDCP